MDRLSARPSPLLAASPRAALLMALPRLALPRAALLAALPRLALPRAALLAALPWVALLACLTAAPAGAAPTLSLSAAITVDGTALTGVSCVTGGLCVAIDQAGSVLASEDPAGDRSWSTPLSIDGGHALRAVSCASTSLCAAVDEEGRVFVSTDPAAGAEASWSGVEIAGAPALTGISCASASLCVAVAGNGDALISTNPGMGTSGTWSPTPIDGSRALSAVSCASTSLCAAVDGEGRVLASSEPAGGASTWHPSPIDLSMDLVAVSCAPAPASLCVAADGAGGALASGNPLAEAPTWSWTPAFTSGQGQPTAISCAAGGLCAAVDGGGGVFTSDDPTAAAPSWTFAGIDPGRELTGVSCVAEGLCAAVDNAGRVLVARVPRPVVASGAPSVLTETSAMLTGTVDPEDATLDECRFEYGPSEAYGQSAPCASPLPTGGAAQAVSATLSGLAAGATYHYRLTASSASGTESTLDATFKTIAPPLAEPHPSIGGIPARGQRLTCKSGVSATASATTVAYAWLRDTKAIAGASGSTYVVSEADVSHHLQCRVTATDAGGSASATSAFVTVPAGGLGAISETQVGAPHVAGATVSVPLTCSAQAAGSCTIALSLTVVETLRGGHTVAVAARRAQRLTVTIGASTAHLPAGQRRAVAVALNATGRRLLAQLHRLTARLSVRGTVVGALSAQLRSATVTLGGLGGASSRGASPGKASVHGRSSRKAPHRRG